MLALLYTFPIGALVLQIVAFMLDSNRIALLALIAPLVFIPQIGYISVPSINVIFAK